MSPLGAVPGLAGQIAFVGAGVSVVGVGPGVSVVEDAGSVVGVGVLSPVPDVEGMGEDVGVGPVLLDVGSAELVLAGILLGELVTGPGVVAGPGFAPDVLVGLLVVTGETLSVGGATEELEPVGAGGEVSFVSPQAKTSESMMGLAIARLR